MAAVDYFLKVDGIEGESQDSKHKGEIQLLSWEWGATAALTGAEKTVSGKMRADDLVCSMKVSKASIGLISAIALNKHPATAVLTCRKAGKDQQEFYKIKLKEVIVSSFATQGGGESAGDVIPIDRVGFNYAQIEFEYREQKPDGTLGGAVMLQINLKSIGK